MDAGDLHDPGRLPGEEDQDNDLELAPQQALAEMRTAVARLRSRLRAAPPADASALPQEHEDDEADDTGDGG
ncbi:MAG: hypothetical protein HOW97_43680 [Catenulispora sp.]|nr:hypothetical protein [Catenulispora sp.]